MKIIELDTVQKVAEHVPLYNNLPNWIARKIGKVDYIYRGTYEATVTDVFGNHWDVFKDSDGEWEKHKAV